MAFVQLPVEVHVGRDPIGLEVGLERDGGESMPVLHDVSEGHDVRVARNVRGRG
jgi:hypothetical protein